MKRKNHDGTIYYNKNKDLYVAQVMIDNVRKSFYGKTEKEAYKKMMSYDSRSCYTFEKWCIKWLKTYKINDYKANTFDREYRRLKNALLRCDFANKQLDEITSTDVQEYINDLKSSLSAKTIKNYMMLINGAFKQAEQENIINNNPCKCISMPKQEKSEMVALNRFERDFFLQVAKDSPYYDVFVFALNTGMRISEICGLTKECIDFDNELIVIKQQLVRIKGKVFLDTPKTACSKRCIPMNNTTYKILQNKFLESKDDYVFHNPISKGILCQNTLSFNAHKCFIKCYEQTKKETYLKANFHSFRHTFATQWLLQGGNISLLSKVLGHTDTAFTMRVYVQPSYDDVKNEMSNLVF